MRGTTTTTMNPKHNKTEQEEEEEDMVKTPLCTSSTMDVLQKGKHDLSSPPPLRKRTPTTTGRRNNNGKEMVDDKEEGISSKNNSSNRTFLFQKMDSCCTSSTTSLQHAPPLSPSLYLSNKWITSKRDCCPLESYDDIPNVRFLKPRPQRNNDFSQEVLEDEENDKKSHNTTSGQGNKDNRVPASTTNMSLSMLLPEIARHPTIELSHPVIHIKRHSTTSNDETQRKRMYFKPIVVD